jgi:hypothetical protein
MIGMSEEIYARFNKRYTIEESPNLLPGGLQATKKMIYALDKWQALDILRAYVPSYPTVSSR